MTTLVALERITTRIRTIREHNVILDADIAALYQVQTKALVRAVQRNLNRFPPDFMFQLTKEELLRRQIGTSKKSGRGGRRYLPYAFTEQGVGMLASVLRSDRKLDGLERKYDGQFKVVFAAIRKLMEPETPKPTRGFGR